MPTAGYAPPFSTSRRYRSLQVLRKTRPCGLGSALANSQLHPILQGQDFRRDAFQGIRQATAEVGADVVALLDSGLGWILAFLSGSIPYQVLHNTDKPVPSARLRPP